MENIKLTAKDVSYDDDVQEVDEFDFGGYQVVRREFYAHKFESAISFKYDSFTANTACINKLESMYVHILINPQEKKLVIRECHEDAKDAVRWCRLNKATQKRVPRKVLCKLFSAKIFDLMKWSAENKYKLQGIVIKTNEEKLIVFNMLETEIYIPVVEDADGNKRGNVPFYPLDWKESFGLPVDEHHSQMVINLLDGYAKLEVQQKREARKKSVKEEVNVKHSLFDITSGEGGGADEK